MELVGKCPPTPESLAAAKDRGFGEVELYLDPDHIDNYEDTLQQIREAAVDISSIHTPHVTPQQTSYFEKSDELATTLNATLVVHSQYLHHTHIAELEAIGFTADYGYENIPGASTFHLENAIIDQGLDLILDTAHLFIAANDYQSAIARLLRNYNSQIPVVHLNDSTVLEDGLPFGHGEIPLEKTVQTLKNYYSGKIVLEVMPENQRDARTKTETWLE